MEIRLDPRQERQLRDLANREGKPVEVVAGELLVEALSSKATPNNGGDRPDPAYEPSRTQLGRTLRALRRNYIEGGGRLYTVAEINREVAEGRGEPPR